MTDMSVSMILKLVDQFSGPAKQAETAAEKFKREMQALNDVKAGTGKTWFDKAQFEQAAQALQKRSRELGAAQRAELEAARAVQAAERAKSEAATAAANQIVAANEKIVSSEQRTLAAVERSAAQQARAEASLQRQRSLAYVQAERERERAEQKARNAPSTASVAGGVIGMGAAYKAKQFATEGLHSYREWSDVNAIMRPIGDLTPEMQTALKAQQLQLGRATRYSPDKIAEAQKLLLERGVEFAMVQPYVAHAVNFASAMNRDLPEAIKTLEAHMFSTGKFKDIHSAADADRIIQRSTDLNTKLNKKGMSNEDISGAWEYGGLPGRQAGLTDETMGAMFALMKRNQIAGTAAGVAMRAIAAKLVSPTQQGIAGLAAIGVNYSNFVKPGGGLTAEGIDSAFDRKFLKHIDAGRMAQLREKLADSELVSDRDKFVHEATELLAGEFKTKKGEVDRGKANSIQKLMASVFDKAIEGVDAEGLLRAIMSKHPSLAALNSFFGFQQGGRAGAALQNPDEFNDIRKQLVETPIGFALEIATERLKSFDGALKQLEGSIQTLQIKIASAFDNSGKGGGPLTKAAEKATDAVNWASALPESIQRGATEFATVGATTMFMKGMGLIAEKVGASTVARFAGLSNPVGWIVNGAIGMQTVTERMEEARLTPKEKGSTYTSDVLLGLSQLLQGHMRWRDPQYEDKPQATPQVDNSKIDETNQKAQSAAQTLQLLHGQQVRPNVDSSGLDAFIAKAEKANSLLLRLQSLGGGRRSFSPSSGVLHDGYETR